MIKKIKVIPVFFLLIYYSTIVCAQSLTMDVLATSGSEVLEEDFSLSWTIGENFIETFTVTEGIQTLGFHQTFNFDELQADTEKHSVWIYPNPVFNTLNIQSKEYVGDATLQIFAVGGELVMERKIHMINSYALNLSFLNEGTWHLRIKNHKIQDFTFIKLNF